MTSSRPPSRPPRSGRSGNRDGGGAPPGTLLAGVATHFRLTLATSLCVLAAGALLVPGLVFGAEDSPADPGQEPDAAITAADAVSTGEAPLVTLPWGSGEGQVGLCRPAEGLTRGPEALAIAPDGRIAVLDSVNRRILLLDAAGQLSGSAPVALAEPRFLAVDDDRLFVLDCDADRRLATFDWSGAGVEVVSIPALPDVVTALFATVDGPCVEVAHRDSFLIAGSVPVPPAAATTAAAAGGHETRATQEIKPAQASLRALEGRPVDRTLDRLARVSFKPGQNPRIRSLTVDRSNLRSTKTDESTPSIASGRPIECLVSVDGDGGGGLIVGARLCEPATDRGEQAYLALTRLAAASTGRLEVAPMESAAGDPGVLFLAESSFAYLGQPYVVAPDGRVFQPVGSEEGYSIFVRSLARGATVPAAEEVRP